jgi:hypothetical protein
VRNDERSCWPGPSGDVLRPVTSAGLPRIVGDSMRIDARVTLQAGTVEVGGTTLSSEGDDVARAGGSALSATR